MLMPSDTVIVLKVTALPPASSAPKPAASANSLMCILHGVRLLQVEAIPTCDFLKSSSVKPTAWSIARAAAFSLPSTTREEYFLPFLFSAIALLFFSKRNLHDRRFLFHKKGRNDPAL